MSENKGITVMIDGKKYEMSFGELAQSNSILLEALIAELTKKGIIDPTELGNTIREVQKARIKEK